MRLISNAITVEELKRDVIQYIELRAEQQRSMERCATGKNVKKLHIHCATLLQCLADDIRLLEIVEG